MAAIASGRYTGSIAGALGDYAEWRRIPLAQFNERDAAPACGKWSEQVRPDDARSFRSVCLSTARDHASLGLRLGSRPSTAQWTRICESRAASFSADTAAAYLATCLKYR